MKHVGVERRFRDVYEYCRAKRRKVLRIVAEAIELADELVTQVCESGVQAAIDANSMTQPAVKTEIVSLSASLKKACDEAVSAKTELDALSPAT